MYTATAVMPESSLPLLVPGTVLDIAIQPSIPEQLWHSGLLFSLGNPAACFVGYHVFGSSYQGYAGPGRNAQGS